MTVSLLTIRLDERIDSPPIVVGYVHEVGVIEGTFALKVSFPPTFIREAVIDKSGGTNVTGLV